MRSHKHNVVASFSYSASPLWTAWRRCGLLVVGIVFFLGLFEAAPLLAQQRSPLDVEEEEEELPGKPAPASRPAGGAPVSPLDMEEEEELPGRAAPMPRPPVGDPLGNPNPLAPAVIPDFSDDDDEANQPEPVCDLLIASLASDGQSRARRIALLPKWLAPPWKPAENYTFSMLNSKGKVSTELRVLGRNIGGIQYYEQRMLRRAADQLQMDPLVLASPLPLNKLLDETPAAGSPFDLASPERQQAAQRAIDLLTTAIGEHDSAVQRRLRADSAFQSHLRQPLVAALFNLEFSRIRAMYHQQRFAQALAACDRLLGQPDLGTRGEAAVHAVVERVLLEPAFEAARAADYETCRTQLDEYLTRYPLKPGARAVQLRDGLIAKAEQLVTRAQANNDPKLLDEAAKIWPRLPDLDGMRRQLQNDYPVLHCGYATLPQNFSPLSIQSLPDRHAVSLMFESLVQWVEDERLGPHYSSQLAAARPGPTARGRHFQLPRCVWSDSDRQTRLCTAEDVQATIDLIKRLRPPGYPPAWENLFEELRYDDPFKFSLQLQRDYWQPLSLMDFRILPAHRFPADQRARDVRSLVEAFQQDPVGTGPYRRAADDGESGGTQIRFVANPHYRRPDLPKIREIVFHQLEPVEAVRQLQNRQLHMIFDLSREHLAQLRLQDERIISLRGRSVHFLAPNYRHSPWLQNEAFRRALA
ncbi:MAG: hypothetical protein KDA62_04455, partial [Planctomycetales bacterium]|nr:hypothetical protein [Planctomycetales bacterium]